MLAVTPPPMDSEERFGEISEKRELRLATWESRFWAWLIDYILIGLVSGVVSASFSTVFDVTGLDRLSEGFSLFGMPWIGVNSILLFLYWTFFEGYNGQSIGKIVLNLQVTDRHGKKIGYGTAAVESSGKAFLLILDCLIGWIAMSGKRLRLFNRLSNTIVIETTYPEPDGVRYVMTSPE